MEILWKAAFWLIVLTNVLKLVGMLYDPSRYSVFRLVSVLYIQRRVCPKPHPERERSGDHS